MVWLYFVCVIVQSQVHEFKADVRGTARRAAACYLLIYESECCTF